MAQISIIKKSELEGASRIDAEYYQPKYLKIVRNLYVTSSYKYWKDIKGQFVTGPFGSDFKVENYIINGKYRYVRGKDVKSFFLRDDDDVYISENDYQRLSKHTLKELDILISVVGTLGNAAIVESGTLPAIFSCKSTVFRSREVSPYYLLAYLNSKYGKKLLERNVRGAVQTGLNIDDLRLLPIFIPSNKDQREIENAVIKAQQKLNCSKNSYLKAEQLLLEELGINNLDFKNDKPYCTVSASKAIAENRLDAEYYQPKYSKLIDHLKDNFETKYFDELMTAKKGIEPGSALYQTNGKPFIRVSNLSKFGITDNNLQYLDKNYYQTIKNNFQPNPGEIILSKDATPGIAYVLKEPVEGIISSGILRIKLTADIEAEYLALLINSTIGKMQIERDAGGSIINHWRPDQIKASVIPILSKSIQKQIADLVQKSHEARKEAKSLLAQAIQKVEQMIEQTANER